MRYIIDGQGNKCLVDDNNVDITNRRIIETVTLVDDSVILCDRYLVTAYKNKSMCTSSKDELYYETSVEKIFETEPTKEELIHFLASNGFGLYDYVLVEKIKQLRENS